MKITVVLKKGGLHVHRNHVPVFSEHGELDVIDKDGDGIHYDEGEWHCVEVMA